MYAFELRAAWKTTVIWIAVLLGYSAMILTMYPSLKEPFQQLIDTMPPGTQQTMAAMGLPMGLIGEGAAGFFALISTNLIMVAGLQAMMLGMRVFHKEWRDKTADFLFTRPRTRMIIYLAKSVSSLTMLAATSVVYIAGIFGIMAALGGSFDAARLLQVCLICPLIQWFFWGIGVLSGITMHKIKAVLPVSLGVVFGLFIFGFIAGSTQVDWLRYLSPFQFYVNGTVYYKGFDGTLLTLGLIIPAFLAASALLIYKRKDIPSV